MRTLRLALVAALALSLVDISSASAKAPAPGSLCSPPGKTIVQSGRKYTCVKSGKKYIWNKGVALKAATPTPTKSATPTALATPTPTPAPTGEVSAVPVAGSACTTLGEQLPTAAGPLECRNAANGKHLYVQLALNPTPPAYVPSAEPIQVCQIPDQRADRSKIPQAIAFPRDAVLHPPALPAAGSVKVAVIPIDFSDVPGAVSPQSIIDPLIGKVNAWLEDMSNGKLKYTWQTSRTWIRASEPSAHYAWTHPGLPAGPGTPPAAALHGTLSGTDIAEELMRDAQDAFDYTDLGVVFFVYPPNVQNIWDALTAFSGVRTNRGVIHIQIDATGAWLYQNHMPIWSWFLHENLHPHGIAGHAPYDGMGLNIMSDQGGLALGLTAWDRLILDWEVPDEFYCTTTEKLSDTVLELASIDSDVKATKAIMVRVSDHQVIVIESRRRSTHAPWLG